jgi:hypothetical protein
MATKQISSNPKGRLEGLTFHAFVKGGKAPESLFLKYDAPEVQEAPEAFLSVWGSGKKPGRIIPALMAWAMDTLGAVEGRKAITSGGIVSVMQRVEALHPDTEEALKASNVRKAYSKLDRAATSSLSGSWSLARKTCGLAPESKGGPALSGGMVQSWMKRLGEGGFSPTVTREVLEGLAAAALKAADGLPKAAKGKKAAKAAKAA